MDIIFSGKTGKTGRSLKIHVLCFFRPEIVLNFEPKKAQNVNFEWFIGPNDLFRLFSHYILCPRGKKNKTNLRYPPLKLGQNFSNRAYQKLAYLPSFYELGF